MFLLLKMYVYMVQWFEKARKLWVEAGSSRNETMIKLAEDFFDALMVCNGTFWGVEGKATIISYIFL